MEFPDRGCLWKFYRNPEFPGHPDLRLLGPHFQRFGGTEVDMLGKAGVLSSRP